MTKSGVPENDARVYAERVRHGGTMVTARVEKELVLKAEAILRGANAVDVPARRKEYQAAGWTGFDPDSADTYTSDHIDAARHTVGPLNRQGPPPKDGGRLPAWDLNSML